MSHEAADNRLSLEAAQGEARIMREVLHVSAQAGQSGLLSRYSEATASRRIDLAKDYLATYSDEAILAKYEYAHDLYYSNHKRSHDEFISQKLAEDEIELAEHAVWMMPELDYLRAYKFYKRHLEDNDVMTRVVATGLCYLPQRAALINDELWELGMNHAQQSISSTAHASFEDAERNAAAR